MRENPEAFPTSTAGQGSSSLGAVAELAPTRSFPRRILRRLLSNPQGLAGLALLTVLLIAGFAAPLLSRYSPLKQFDNGQLLGPSLQHFFGTDDIGRDLYSRTLYGLRSSLIISVLAVGIGGAVGSLIGLIAAYRLGWADIVLMRLMDGFLAFPGILLGIAVIAAFGASSRNVGLVVAIFNLPIFARIARGAVLVEKRREYVDAARALGVSGPRILFWHILINISSPLIVQFALAISFAVFLEAGLEFLGLGARPPAPTLGSLLNGGQQYLRDAPWYALLPGLVLALLLTALNFLADAVNEALTGRA